MDPRRIRTPKDDSHAHTAEDDDPPRKRVKRESEDSSSEDEYVLIFVLTGTVTHGSKDWLIGSWDSKHMTIQGIFRETI